MATTDQDLIVARPEGLYCPAGDFFIDPWRPVARAVVTHAHADHARTGHGDYLAAHDARHVLRARLGQIRLQTVAYGQPLTIGAARVSLHPAGHVLGSAQVRIEAQGSVSVVSGDYKLEPEATCVAFEPVPCDTFITEATFGLPVYRWPDTSQVAADIVAWRRECEARGEAAVLLCYALGKAQRILAELLPLETQPALLHGAIATGVAVYREAGIPMLATEPVSEQERGAAFAGKLILAPPSAAGSTWMRRFGDYSDAFASGWMRLRGTRRRRGVDRGFVLSDHADWPGLLWAIEQTGAERVMVTHGSIGVLVRHLREQGLDAQGFNTEYGDDEEENLATEPTIAEMPA